MDFREQALALSIRMKLAEDTRTYGQTIDVLVANGDIYLVGACDSELQRLIAEEIIRGLPGVRKVVDNIRIRHERAVV